MVAGVITRPTDGTLTVSSVSCRFSWASCVAYASSCCRSNSALEPVGDVNASSSDVSSIASVVRCTCARTRSVSARYAASACCRRKSR